MKDICVKRLWNHPPRLRRATETRQYVAGQFTHEGPARPSHEAMKIKPGLLEPPHVGGIRVVGYLPRTVGEQLKRWICSQAKLEGRAIQVL